MVEKILYVISENVDQLKFFDIISLIDQNFKTKQM